MRKEFQAIKRALQQSKRSVRKSQVWMRICEEYDVGQIVGENILLSETDCKRLREIMIQTTNVDPLTEDINGDREAMAKKSRNEKLSGQSVFADQLQVARTGGKPIPFKTGHGVTPHGTLLSTTIENLDFKRIDAVLVIENGTTMLNWHRIKLPFECKDAIIVYRGHGNNLRDVMVLKQRLKAEAILYVYPDFDPKGVQIATELNCDAIVVHEDWLAFKPGNEFYEKCNKIETFRLQESELDKVVEQGGSPFQKLLVHMQKYHTALTQEHLSAYNCGLTVLVPT